MGAEPGQEPWGTRWPLRHPRAHLALMVLSFLWLGVLAATRTLALVRGPHRDGASVLAAAFGLGLLAMSVVGLRAAIRIVRDPGAEAERRQRLRERALALPPEVLRRKVAGALAVIALVMVGSGVAVLAVGAPADRLWGWLLVGLGVVAAARGAWRLLRSTP